MSVLEVRGKAIAGQTRVAPWISDGRTKRGRSELTRLLVKRSIILLSRSVPKPKPRFIPVPSGWSLGGLPVRRLTPTPADIGVKKFIELCNMALESNALGELSICSTTLSHRDGVLTGTVKIGKQHWAITGDEFSLIANLIYEHDHT